MLFYHFKHYIIFFIISLISEMFIKCEELELCHTPVHSMDRFDNNTVRLFHENDYWDLDGFPQEINLTAKGSMKDYEFFNPVNKSAKIVTVLEGSPHIKGRSFKFQGIYWWSWYNHPKFGLRSLGTEVGFYWDEIPKNHGFDAIFHNGDKNDPMLIGLEFDPKYSDKKMKIHYFSTENNTFQRKFSNYFDEIDFPIDIIDAISLTTTPDSKYNIFMLRSGDKYCILTKKEKCSWDSLSWKSFKALLKCTGLDWIGWAPPSTTTTTTTTTTVAPTEANPKAEWPLPQHPTKPTINPFESTPKVSEGQLRSNENGSQNIVFSLLSILLSFICFVFI